MMVWSISVARNIDKHILNNIRRRILLQIVLFFALINKVERNWIKRVK